MKRTERDHWAAVVFLCKRIVPNFRVRTSNVLGAAHCSHNNAGRIPLLTILVCFGKGRKTTGEPAVCVYRPLVAVYWKSAKCNVPIGQQALTDEQARVSKRAPAGETRGSNWGSNWPSRFLLEFKLSCIVWKANGLLWASVILENFRTSLLRVVWKLKALKDRCRACRRAWQIAFDNLKASGK